jgi:hypothetical protein
MALEGRLREPQKKNQARDSESPPICTLLMRKVPDSRKFLALRKHVSLPMPWLQDCADDPIPTTFPHNLRQEHRFKSFFCRAGLAKADL